MFVTVKENKEDIPIRIPISITMVNLRNPTDHIKQGLETMLYRHLFKVCR